jgi:osmotically-inducible protein OsmY
MERSKRAIILMVIFSTLLMPTGCRKNKDNVNHAQADFEITKAIREEFFKENISIEVHVETKDLTVSLTGAARSSEEKEKAVKIAESTKVVIDGKEYGVKNVDASKLEIKGAVN